MKRFISACLVLLMVFAAMGCTATGTETPATAEPATSGTASTTETTTTEATVTTEPSNETIKIGVAIPESGMLAAFMVWFRTGISTAVNEINKAGGINGKMVEVIVGDTGSGDTATCMQRISELREAGCVAIITSTAFGGVQWAADNSVPVVLYSNTSTDETIVNFNDYVYMSGLNAWGLSKVLALETVGKLGIESFVYVGVDQACTIDAENLLIYEGKKINPDFHMISSYRMGWDDDKFATIVSTIMSLQEKPGMILQQGGGPNFVSLAQQATLYGLFEYCDLYNDLTTDTSTAATLVEAGTFPYGKTHGISLLQWWNKDDAAIQDYVNRYYAASIELTGKQLQPSDSGYTCYLGTMSILKAVQYCDDNGLDYNDGTVLNDAMKNVSWSDFSGEHAYRDFDHVLTFNAYYVTSADGGEEFGHYPIGADAVLYTADEYLPTLEDMKIYAAQLGYPDRFN